MSFDLAVRLTEIMLGLVFIQQSLEHLKAGQKEKLIFGTKLMLSVLLIAGVQSQLVLAGLVVIALLSLKRFQGPYNGGSDRMGLLILCCLTLVKFLPVGQMQEVAFAYLALQLVLSYFVSGWVKVVNLDWRTGRALQDVFLFSAYPVSEGLRKWSERPRLLSIMSWCVILFELLFPISLLTPLSLIFALVIAAVFHFANACLFGLNRFFWTWLAAYPSIIWFQERFVGEMFYFQILRLFD